MPQCPFIFHEVAPDGILRFPHITGFGVRTNNTVKLDSFELTQVDNLRVYHILDGKFEWIINDKNETLYPGDSVLVLPGQKIGGLHGYLGIGTLFWLHLKLDKIEGENRLGLGKWSRLKKSERKIICNILISNETPAIRETPFSQLFQDMQSELQNQEIGYKTRVNYMLDNLLILMSRQISSQSTSRRDFPQTFRNLEHALRKNLSHKWTVEEMAAMVGLGTTAFTEKVRNFTGFPPLNYLINIRISEAIKLLKLNDINITDIALETGFYSSQHFSTTFKKLTGHTPNEFRKRYTLN